MSNIQECERSLIGAILSTYEETAAFRPLLTPEDFTNSDAKECWSIFIKTTTPEEYISLCCENGLAVFASACMDSDLPSSAAGWCAEKIKKASLGRRLLKEIHEIFNRGDDVLEELASLVGKELDSASKEKGSLSTSLREAAIANLFNKDIGKRLFTGISPLDRIIQGFRKGNVSILGAEPSTGKTALALDIALSNIRHNRKVLVFSLEMSAVQMMDRLISNAAQIPYASINDKWLPDEDRAKYIEFAHKLTEGDRVTIVDNCYYVEQMLGYVMQIKPDMVIVDFIQFCRTSVKTNNTADKLEYIMSEFKRIAKIESCQSHIMLLSQPSREATKTEKTMFNLKGSSALEQGGDVILLLDRPAVRDPAYPVEKAFITVAKNKFGRTGKVELFFDGNFQLFREKRETDFYTTASESRYSERPWEEETDEKKQEQLDLLGL